MSAGRRQAVATLLGTCGAVLWASETALLSYLDGVPPLQIVAVTFAVATLLTLLTGAAAGASPWPALRQPRRVWAFAIGSLLAYHVLMYLAVPRAPAAPAAVLQGCTPLFIVLGSAFLPGQRLRWWHAVGALAGFLGVLTLLGDPGDAAAFTGSDVWYLGLVAVTAGLWGLYSLATRLLPALPLSGLGLCYGGVALLTGAGHLLIETAVAPSAAQWLAMLTLGALPTGLAIALWTYGMQHGNVQVLGACAYLEPLAGALLVIALGQGEAGPALWVAAALIIGGAALAARGPPWRSASSIEAST